MCKLIYVYSHKLQCASVIGDCFEIDIGIMWKTCLLLDSIFTDIYHVLGYHSKKSLLISLSYIPSRHAL